MTEVEVKNGDYVALIQHAQSQLSSSKLIEEAVDKIMGSTTNGNFEYFPVVLGRRHQQQNQPQRPERPASAPLRQRSPLGTGISPIFFTQNSLY